MKQLLTYFSFGRNRVLSPQSTHVSVLGLNALLVESPKTLTEGFGAETHAAICQGVSNKDVSFNLQDSYGLWGKGALLTW